MKIDSWGELHAKLCNVKGFEYGSTLKSSFICLDPIELQERQPFSKSVLEWKMSHNWFIFFTRNRIIVIITNTIIIIHLYQIK